MARKKIYRTTIPLLADFHAWASMHLTTGTAGNYCSYLKNIPNVIGINPNNYLSDYLRIIGSYIMNGSRIYALSVLDIMCNAFINYGGSLLTKTHSNCQSALRKYKEFITVGIDYSKPFQKCTGVVYKPTDPQLIYFQKQISKTNCATIDSMNGLIHVLGVDKFIKMAIEQSLFFCKNIVNKQFSIISSQSEPNDPGFLYARASTLASSYSTKNLSQYYQKEYVNGTYSCDVIIDGKTLGGRKYNENHHVQAKINDYTGYTLIGKHSILKNYIISHIWGQATDPRYFTNFWNIVLVPAWANFLLDKNPPQASLASKFKATMMSICDNFFNMSNMNWSPLMMNKPANYLSTDIIPGDYNLQIINEKTGTHKLGNITNVLVTI